MHYAIMKLPSLIAVAKANVSGITDPFAEADEDTGETKLTQNYIHIRIQRKRILVLTSTLSQHSPSF